MPEELTIHFQLGSQEHNVCLHEQGKREGSDAVVIGGVSYTLAGKDESIGFVKHCLSQIPLSSGDSFIHVGRELKARMWMAGAEKVAFTTTDKAHFLGLSILGGEELVDIPAIVNEIADQFEKYYIYPDIGQKCADFLRWQLLSNAYDPITDIHAFTAAVTADLRSISEDKHILFEPNAAQAPAIEESLLPDLYTTPALHQPYEFKPSTDIGLMGRSVNSLLYEVKSGFIDKGCKIGYLDLRIFGITAPNHPDGIPDAEARRDALIDAVQNIENAHSVIIDLRDNGGGDPSTVQLLCSLFMDEGFPLNTIINRENQTVDFVTLSREVLPAEKRMTEARMFVLTSPMTGSAAEEFANDVKVLSRGVIVGEPSTGAANPCTQILIGDGDKFALRLPDRRAYNPLQEGNWEGVGIIPDEMVPAEEALQEAVLLARQQ